jgi:hypothetical protein
MESTLTITCPYCGEAQIRFYRPRTVRFTMCQDCDAQFWAVHPSDRSTEPITLTRDQFEDRFMIEGGEIRFRDALSDAQRAELARVLDRASPGRIVFL